MTPFSPRHSRIALLEHAGYGNLGDDATVASVLHQLRRRWPHAHISGITLNPHDTSERHGISVLPIHRDCKAPPADAPPVSKMKATWRDYPVVGKTLRAVWALFFRYPRNLCRELVFLARGLRALRSLDLLVICGGGQLRDNAGGPYTFPLTLLKWVVMAKLRGAQCCFLNLGAGPLRTRSSRLFVRTALRFSSYTSFRDENSRRLIQQIGFRKSSSVHADCVYALPFQIPDRSREREAKRGTVGVSPMRVYWDRDPRIYARLIRELAKFGAWLGKGDHPVCLFSSEVPSDYEPIDDLLAATISEGMLAPVRCPRIAGVDDLLQQMSEMDYVVTCRFHGIVFAHLLHIPVLAVSHHPKVSTLMNDLGLSEYCLDVHTVAAEDLMETFARLQENQGAVRERMRELADLYRADLIHQFDSLFPPVITSRPAESRTYSIPVSV